MGKESGAHIFTFWVGIGGARHLSESDVHDSGLSVLFCDVNTKRTMEFLHLSIDDYIPEASNYDAGSRVIVNQHHSQNHRYTPAVTLIKG